jgi:hypothetical protein
LQKDAECACACSDCEDPQNQQIVHSRNSPKKGAEDKEWFPAGSFASTPETEQFQ